MKSKLLTFLALIALLIGYLYINRTQPEGTPVEINNQTIFVDVADSPVKQAKGLMFRKSLDENRGMLFVFEREAKHSFWMKNTLIPLDMLWLNTDKEIIHIEHSAPPCKEDPCPTFGPQSSNAKYVLEVNGGWSIENSVGLGDSVNFEL